MKKKTSNAINIAFITDDNFAMPTYIALQSMLMNKFTETAYNIYILHSDIQDFHIKNIKKLSANNFKITFIQIENDYADLEMKNLHVTPIAVTKFKLSSIFESVDKLLYLDGDIVVQGDLSLLYNTNLKDKYAGVVKDMAPMLLYKPNICKKLNIPHSGYFNSGMMLLNLKKIREDRLEEKLISYRKNGLNYFMDQDALNVCFKENVVYLNLRNNFLVTLQERFSIDEICKYYNIKSTEIFENSLIIHYCSKFKPWKCYDADYENIWYAYFKKSPYKKILYHRISKFNNCLPVCTIREQIIISMTSYPARIQTINQTIYSLLNQNVKADKIILWLATEQFPNKEADLPPQLTKLTKIGLDIEWYHDIKSYKKLIPCLQKYQDSIIVTTDDDVVYSQDWLEKLLLSYIKYPKAIHCHRGHCITFKNDKIEKYTNWIWHSKSDNPMYNNLFTGVGGVLYPPHCLHQDIFDEKKFMRLCPQGDDIWFWAMAVKNSTPIKIVEKNITKLNFIDGTQETALWKNNVIEGQNDIQLQNVLKEYPEILDKLDKTITKPEAAPKTIAEKAPAKPKTITEKSSAKSKPKKYSVSYKIFKFIALYTHKKRGGNQVWKILGLPVWRKRKFTDNQTVKYYLLGIPLFEIAKIGSKF